MDRSPFVPGFDRDAVEVAADDECYTGFFELRRLRLRHRLFAGGWSPPLERELILRRPAVGILLYDPQLDAVALVEQFRIGAFRFEPAAGPARSPWLLELVAGLIDDDSESADRVARREAQEEAGCEVRELEFICDYFSSPGGNNELFSLYCGRCDLRDVGGLHGLPEEGEDIRVHVFAVAEALGMLQGRAVCNAHTIIALQWLQLNQQRLREQWRDGAQR